MIVAQQDYTSIGCLAGQLQQSVRKIEAAAAALGITAAMRLNHVQHFDAGQVEAIAEHLRNASTTKAGG